MDRTQIEQLEPNWYTLIRARRAQYTLRYPYMYGCLHRWIEFLSVNCDLC